MKYMLLIHTDPADGPRDPAEGQKMMDDYAAFTAEIIESGEMVAGDALQGNDTATSVRVRAGKVATTDGPYAETKEHLGGFYVVDVKDLDRAIELAARIPGAHTGTIEVRPVMEFDQG